MTAPASGMVPVFPLPNVVFFPGTVLPLHVFEPRYRDLVRDASRGDGRIAVTLLRPGFEADYEGRPAFHTIATVGRIRTLRPLPDGRSLIDLVGIERVRLDEIASPRRYRLARATPLPERAPDERDPAVSRHKLDLLATVACLLRETSDEPDAAVVLDDRRPYAEAVNDACAHLPVDGETRQRLLETDDLEERARSAGLLAAELLELALRDRDEAPETLPN